MEYKYDICVIGGGGHVGLPLAIAFADKGVKVSIYDINKDTIKIINKGKMPFLETGAEDILRKVLNKTLYAYDNPEVISQSKFLVITVGTPVDEHLNPDFNVMNKFLKSNLKYFHDDQILILRSTVFPGTTYKIKELLNANGLKTGISFCPERIAEGKAMEELYSLPQIISGFKNETIEMVRELFLHITKDVIVITPLEAELAKLFTNSWRYIQFAVANQFYMMAEYYGLDFYNIYNAMIYKYPRAKNFPRPGFAAGPCLFKDTMQLSAFNNNNFYLGHSAMLVNEGLPNYIVNRLKNKYELSEKIVGILGMAFKSESDDIRESLSFKLKKILEFETKQVLCSDEYVKRDEFIKKEELIAKSDIIIIGAPHKEYKDLKINNNKIVVDIWNLLGKGGLI